MNNTILTEIFEYYFDVCAVDLDRFSLVLNIILVLCDHKRKKIAVIVFILISSLIWRGFEPCVTLDLDYFPLLTIFPKYRPSAPEKCKTKIVAPPKKYKVKAKYGRLRPDYYMKTEIASYIHWFSTIIVLPTNR